ncbi:N-acetyllactosaminide beta-1,3-N-acetylglucosaminyltransferase 2 [Micropterus dolomieu]|uniref:N-acetyllactosaminide beta-1,3-N-acetylglucosaminyltransferase 2 n=1 Tax=Micropterus dolomieu TaxID=147949 RepID=UPI001E8EC935|nr:N-acetyllactosaminide beta-1,3-N-acetylglucosaminyltransferase 2 [Micropterus dolomieu]XP_045886859.1 N-acetyllactosaminide beta-1,3-N-acetylglucosaminyltransferase 2 [Micropterus dolomieu]XP_045886860.1 N-acetyllactosaminide beta-1,3-N-acetylglucosaminyltransferase 2 [Micropterus dolomieu]
MARCFCRWCNVLFCLCTLCICLALLFIYISVMVCMSMNGGAQKSLETLHFVASGTCKNKNFASHPKAFWEVTPDRDAFWNQLQLAIDRHFNPILRPNNTKRRSENSNIHESLLRKSYSEVTNLDSTKRNFDELPQEMQDFVRHMQRRDYPTLIQPDGVCGAGAKDEKEPVMLLLAIKTTKLNFQNRQAIRQTWGQAGWVAGKMSNRNGGEEAGGYVRRVFLLGKEESQELDEALLQLLQIESNLYEDILQWDFNDTFFNLTLKDVLFWSWFSHFCSQTRFVFKGDDDVFLNTPKMINYLQDQLKKPQAHKTIKDFMVGDVIDVAIPIRVNNSKYFIPDSFYKGFYPPYAGGGGVVYSGLLIKRLHYMSKRVHMFPIDDVFVGMCMIRLNAYPVHHPAFLTFDFPEKEGEELCAYHTILLVHKRSPTEVVRLWTDMKKTQRQCWDVPLRAADKNKIKQTL